MSGHRLRAPSMDGGVLALPSLDQCESLAWSNFRRLMAWDYDIQGRPAAELRRQARLEFVESSYRYLALIGQVCQAVSPDALDRPLVLSGHQPEMYHPGVWVKNLVGAKLASAVGGISGHLIVDNDLPKSAGLRVPTQRGHSLHTTVVDFDRTAPEVPFEHWFLSGENSFGTFLTRVGEATQNLIDHPLLEKFWPVAGEQVAQNRPIGIGFSAARRSIENNWGVFNHDLPLSDVCQSESFLWFFCHLVAHLDRFHTIHNQALEAYRQLNRIRSRNHPVPPLKTQGDWKEAPFWVWHSSSPRRRSLLIRATGQEMLLKIAGETEAFLKIPLNRTANALESVELLKQLPALGIALRTRALTTTLFSRLILGDLFIHGIGGAKYDELGDTILEQFFGIKAPVFLTLSLTLWLGLPNHQISTEMVRSLKLQARDLVFNPDRHLGVEIPAIAQELVKRKQAAIQGPVETHAQRASRCRMIKQLNLELIPFVVQKLQATREEISGLEKQLQEDRWARYREFSSVLFSETKLGQEFHKLG